jgi:hypothetical protein
VFLAKLARNARRDCETVFEIYRRHCERKRSNPSDGKESLDCFVASLSSGVHSREPLAPLRKRVCRRQ